MLGQEIRTWLELAGDRAGLDPAILGLRSGPSVFFLVSAGAPCARAPAGGGNGDRRCRRSRTG